MRRKIISISICMLLIATTATASVISNKEQEMVSSEIDDYEENIETTGSWEDCMAACLGITGLAGNCLYVIIGCTVFPGPWNPCCLSIPLFCGIDIGLFFGCLSQCADVSGAPPSEEEPCVSPVLLALSNFLQKINAKPAFFIGMWFLLRCLSGHCEDVEKWFEDRGMHFPIDCDNIDNLPVNVNTRDCGCPGSS